MKKTIKMIIAAVLMVGMMGTQVFAADGVENTASDKSTGVEQSFTFKSSLSVPENTIVPNVGVKYTIAGVADSTSGRIAGPDIAAPNNEVTVSFSGSDNTVDGVVSKNVTFTFPADTFTKVGIYRYKITQEILSSVGVVAKSTSPTTQYLDVFVQNKDDGNGLEVAYFVLSDAGSVNADNEYSNKSNGFENEYNSHTLTVKKEVAGNQGDKSQGFSFTIKIEGSTGKTYNYKLSSGGTGTLTSGTPETITLKHGETIEITGLTDQDTYTVEEAAATGYTTQYKIGDTTTDGNTATNTDGVSADTRITFINTKNANTPTGVIMTFMPYILMIVAGAIVAVVFLRRKRS